MIALTFQTGTGAMGDPVRPELVDAYPGARVAVRDRYPGTATNRFPVEVLDEPTRSALTTDYRFPVIDTDLPVTVSAYRSALRRCHDARLAEVIVSVQVGSVTHQLPGTQEYQQHLHGCAIEVLAGASSVVLCVVGGRYTLTGAQLLDALAAYRTALRSVGGVDHIALRGAIEAARTLADLDLVEIG